MRARDFQNVEDVTLFLDSGRYGMTVWGSSHPHFHVIPRFWNQFGLDKLDDCERLGIARSPETKQKIRSGYQKPRTPAWTPSISVYNIRLRCCKVC